MGEQLQLKHENDENDLRVVAVVKDSIVVGFEYRRRLIRSEKYSCSASSDNFLSNVHTRDSRYTCYSDVISLTKYNFCELVKNYCNSLFFV